MGVLKESLCLGRHWGGSYESMKDLEYYCNNEVYGHIVRDEHGDTYPYLLEVGLSGGEVRNMFEVVVPCFYMLTVLTFENREDLKNYLLLSESRVNYGPVWYPENIEEVRNNVKLKHDENRKG